MSGWETRIVTGNPHADHATLEQHRQAAAAQGLAFDAQPLPTGGFQVRAYPAAAAGVRPAAGWLRSAAGRLRARRRVGTRLSNSSSSGEAPCPRVRAG